MGCEGVEDTELPGDSRVFPEGVLQAHGELGWAGDALLQILGQFRHPYEESYYYWQCWEITRRLLQTGFVVLVDMLGGADMALVYAVLIATFAIVLHQRYSPYQNDSLDELQLTILVNQFLVQIGLVMIQLQSDTIHVIGFVIIMLQVMLLSYAMTLIMPVFRPVFNALGRKSEVATRIVSDGLSSLAPQMILQRRKTPVALVNTSQNESGDEGVINPVFSDFQEDFVESKPPGSSFALTSAAFTFDSWLEYEGLESVLCTAEDALVDHDGVEATASPAADGGLEVAAGSTAAGDELDHDGVEATVSTADEDVLLDHDGALEAAVPTAAEDTLLDYEELWTAGSTAAEDALLEHDGLEAAVEDVLLEHRGVETAVSPTADDTLLDYGVLETAVSPPAEGAL
ncbi:hypothetical protein CYMTET_30371 [Cymbomonas tetramitiformis]|uniref:TRP C-terminal domain-containing protein n=1 Tax=Cymbomonas tetramitiformis TaxID=36881 RepID=A0AAE0FJE9_9CHLO|nr:hypothetical protein CYMTET_30371 [Cymbomonas tetramitiformis]